MKETIIVKGVEIWYAKLNPEKPSKKFDKKRPAWEIQIRTKSREQFEGEFKRDHGEDCDQELLQKSWESYFETAKTQMREWKDLNLNVNKSVVLDDVDEPIPEKSFWKVAIKRKSTNYTGEENDPVEVVNNKRKAVDPTSIGNGSIGNLKLFQYDYDYRSTGGTAGIASQLMGIQLRKHIVYTGADGEDFDEEDTATETVAAQDDDNEDFDKEEAPETEASKISVGTKKDENEDF